MDVLTLILNHEAKFADGWFSTQLLLSLSIGVPSFLLFCFLRTRWQLVYMPRTRLKAHWPDVQGTANSFFGWIVPTIRTSEYVVLQSVGLDAAVLLGFFRMGFFFFATLTVIAAFTLMPYHYYRGGSLDWAPPDSSDNSTQMLFPIAIGRNTTTPSLPEILESPQTIAVLQLVFAYLFTFILLRFLHKNYHHFVSSRQSFALELLHSVSSRTVIVSDVPNHLRGDRVLAEYFEGCGWDVESVSVCRDVQPIRDALDLRTEALLQLERAWVAWVGNPAKAVGYSPDIYSKNGPAAHERETDVPTANLISGFEDPNNGASVPAPAPADDPESLRRRYGIISTDRSPPTIRPHLLSPKVDAIEYWENKLYAADDIVRSLRKTGKFPASHVAFVTFEDVKSAQASSQVVHYPVHSKVVTSLAPEPRDVLWNKVNMGATERRVRSLVIMGAMTVLLVSWAVPLYPLASLLTDKEIAKRLPWLWKIIKDDHPRLHALFTNFLPSLVFIGFNSLLPFLLEWLCYQQGFRSRSATEYSLIRKHFLFLLILVIFVFISASTYWVLREWAESPSKLPEKLADALKTATARSFMVSYVILYSLGLMPLQLLNIGPLVNHTWMRLWAKTPREFAEANAPPPINYGWVYPQALLIFTITLIYSIVSPRILIFGTIYFGMAYLVYKYKLLFIYFKPFESNGEAWKISFDRLLWALIIFQLFMTGLLSLEQNFVLTGLMLPLISFTLWWGYTMSRDFTPLSKHIALSSICEVERGDGTPLGGEGPTSASLSGLNHKRYAVNDDTLYVAPSDRRTNYSQPPMNNFYWGVLNTGRRRYAHPALNGKLPTPWLPENDRPPAFGDGAAERRGVVLSLRRRLGRRFRKQRNGAGTEETDDGRTSRETTPGSVNEDDPWASRSSGGQSSSQPPAPTRRDTSNGSEASSTPSNPWAREATPPPAAAPAAPPSPLDYDVGSGVIALGDEHVWHDHCDSDEEDTPTDTPAQVPESPSTYFHRPNRRRLASNATLSQQ
ncbi:Calcium permeable stress-gated cation channel 1 [Vanrija pseudolonga]|uniref:Calcium permeable stress-gated cation channel 1 n=1 Tax=Vanrija pseudolonga TaxID=143232 RepID=A0AAF0Y9T6_9TREE|nr:Calcium permeable stress-gated cation channel 1 [Vanrija pseudolonga]